MGICNEAYLGFAYLQWPLEQKSLSVHSGTDIHTYIPKWFRPAHCMPHCSLGGGGESLK
jgi:hypothetical protein